MYDKTKNIIILFSFIFLLLGLYYVLIHKNNLEQYKIPEQDMANISSYRGTDVSGSVWLNNDYDVKKEDPGLSWVL